jgi:Winged helix DNA-binding domain
MPFTFQVVTFMSSKIAWARLHCQRLAAGRLASPEEVVGWLGAVQAQEYHLAKWGLALRTRRASDHSVERAFAAGRILRTHVMRATWHFVTPADIRWLLAVTAPRVRAAVAYYDRQLGITPGVITRANRAIARALAGGAQLTRAELKAVLTGAGVSVDGTQRLAHVIMHAELSAVICNGARRGKQFTYALLDDRAPVTPLPTREEGLAELARRYFTSHGPAQLKDFVWWSGLTAAEARIGLEMSRHHLAEEEIGGSRYWLAPSARSLGQPRRAAYLLPPYDEFLIAYKDRSASLDPGLWRSGAGRGPYAAPVVLDGRVIGGWRRASSGDSVTITFDLPGRLPSADAPRIEEAARRYGDFLGETVIAVTV